MTVLDDAPTALQGARGKPIGTFAGLPLYATGTAPAHLRTRSQLERGLRLTLAPGQRPVCYVRPYFHPDERRALYDPAQAVRVVRTVGEDWAWRARRTCPRCGRLREYLTHDRPCGLCRKADRERAAAIAARTCDECHRIGEGPYPQAPMTLTEGWWPKRLCRTCTAARRRKLAALLAEAIHCPGGCGKRTAVKKKVLAWALANHRAIAAWPRRRCEPCEDAHRIELERLEAEREARWAREAAERAERERLEREARASEVAELEEWAAGVLADLDAVFLDTETTGLEDDARIVDIAVVTADGTVLLDTLVNPGVPIPPESTRIHGITDADVADAPSFAQVLPTLAEAVAGKRVLVYNLPFDDGRLRHELSLLGVDTAGWMATARWEDVMVPYSDWYGDWNDYFGNYSWQPLDGTHGARGDCLAAIERVREMARDSASTAEAA